MPDDREDWRDWRAGASCVGVVDMTKHSDVSRRAAREEVRDLVGRYCHSCPVKRECLQWAYETKWFVGIAGGAFFENKNAGARRRARVRIPVAVENGWSVAVNRRLNESVQVGHYIEPDAPSHQPVSARALCGATVTPNEGPSIDEQLRREAHAMAANRCDVCRGIAYERRAALRRRAAGIPARARK